jgi:hypothetical protein
MGPIPAEQLNDVAPDEAPEPIPPENLSGQTDAPERLADGRMLLRLDAPIQAHGEEIDALAFRRLRPEDLDRVGYPLRVHEDGAKEPIPKHISALIGRLAGIPPSSVAQLTIADWERAMGVVVSFFARSRRTS